MPFFDYLLPNHKRPIDRLLRPVSRLLGRKSSSGIVLFVATLMALAWANSPWGDTYTAFWEYELAFRIGERELADTLHHWINEGLMAVFFFLIGLEIKREVLGGELSSLSKAAMPIAAALGGMVVPAAIYVAFNAGTETAHGWGIPMATDIAFTLGILSLLGDRVPTTLKVFLTALAIVDDMGAVLVIAFVYTTEFSPENLIYGGIFMGVLIGGNLLGIRATWFYALVGIVGLWLAFLQAGLHATLAGILLATTIPGRARIDEKRFLKDMDDLIARFRKTDHDASSFVTSEQLDLLEQMKQESRDAETPLQKLEHHLDPVVSYLIMPLFALANAGVIFNAEAFENLLGPAGLGIFFGLAVGKAVGITAFAWLVVRLGWAKMPDDMSWGHVLGVGFMAGIGFTMSLFISELAFESQDEIVNASKASILFASFVAGAVGFFLLRRKVKAPEGSRCQAEEGSIARRHREISELNK